MKLFKFSPRIASPGDLIADELEARGWTRSKLAETMGVTCSEVVELIAGAPLTTELAAKLAGAFGTSVQLWGNLEASYRRRSP